MMILILVVVVLGCNRISTKKPYTPEYKPVQEYTCPMNNWLPNPEKISENIDLWDDSGTPSYSKSEIFSPEEFINSAGSPEKSAICFVKNYPKIFKLDNPENELMLLRAKKDERNNTHILFQRIYQGIIVSRSQLAIHFNSKGQINIFNGRYRPSFTIPTNPAISPEKAIKIAKKDSGLSTKNITVNLLIYPDQKSYLLSWEVKMETLQFPRLSYIIDANTGKIIYKDTGIRT